MDGEPVMSCHALVGSAGEVNNQTTGRDGTVWHTEDIRTGHQDFVGEEWLSPSTAHNNQLEVKEIA